MKLINRAYFHKLCTEWIYTFIRITIKPVVFLLFNPIVINQDFVPRNGPTIFAPNHRSTLDPFFISSANIIPIHWLALKRFFTGEDSIFNNSKNIILCRITAILFKSIGAVPMERGKKNIKSLRRLHKYLEMGGSIGMFPEGTTNKNPMEQEILSPNSGFIHLANSHNAWVQPISIVWIPLDIKTKNKLIINFRPAFKVDGTDFNTFLSKWYDSVKLGVEENYEIIRNL